MRCKSTGSIHIIFQMEKTVHTHLCEAGVTKSSKRRPESQAAGQPGASLRGRSNLLPGKNPATASF